MTEFAHVGFAHIILRMGDLHKWDLSHRGLPITHTVIKGGLLQYYTRFMTRDSGGANAPLNRYVTLINRKRSQ